MHSRQIFWWRGEGESKIFYDIYVASCYHVNISKLALCALLSEIYSLRILHIFKYSSIASHFFPLSFSFSTKTNFLLAIKKTPSLKFIYGQYSVPMCKVKC